MSFFVLEKVIGFLVSHKSERLNRIGQWLCRKTIHKEDVLDAWLKECVLETSTACRYCTVFRVTIG